MSYIPALCAVLGSGESALTAAWLFQTAGRPAHVSWKTACGPRSYRWWCCIVAIHVCVGVILRYRPRPKVFFHPMYQDYLNVTVSTSQDFQTHLSVIHVSPEGLAMQMLCLAATVRYRTGRVRILKPASPQASTSLIRSYNSANERTSAIEDGRIVCR